MASRPAFQGAPSSCGRLCSRRAAAASPRQALLQAVAPLRRRRRRPTQVQVQQAEAAAEAEQPYADPFAEQRKQLGARVVRHLAGIDLSPDLQDAVRLLPVHVEAPAAWHELAAGVAAHGSAALHAALAPRRRRPPAFGTLAHCRCQLTSTTEARRFRSRQLNACLALLFEQAPAAAALAGLPPIQLSRWDLHHGHLFFEPGSARLGLLLHAREYPAADPEGFPVDLGRCQAGGTPPYDARAQQLRNLVWLGGRLACLDLAAPALQPLLMPGLEAACTVLESDLGVPLGCDINYFAELAGRKSAERLFVCTH